MSIILWELALGQNQWVRKNQLWINYVILMTFEVQKRKTGEKMVNNINMLPDFSPLFFSWQYMADYGIRDTRQ